ncbi:MAG: hydroxyisourate hydrolase [Polyangiaceae bacterium]|jgi:5-hydroxyisourate hydrolase
MMAVTSHVLDLELGRPASGVTVRLDQLDAGGRWQTVGEVSTDEDGRTGNLLPGENVDVGTYRVAFDTGAYWRCLGRIAFYPEVYVVFRVEKLEDKYHIPLLLSPFGYSTYRGS